MRRVHLIVDDLSPGVPYNLCSGKATRIEDLLHSLLALSDVRIRIVVDKALLKVPVFGELIKKIAVSRFTRTLGTLVSSGVPILDGLMITAKSAGNKVIEHAILETRLSISEGKTIAAPLEECDVFPPMVTQMISVGESTGSLDAMLSKIADFYDDEVDNTVSNLTSLMEPMMMVFLGGVIGGLMMAMYLPIFKMASIVG